MRTISATAAFLLWSSYPLAGVAADQNGYTAQYECRAGGPFCNLDVAAIAKQSCDQIITTADSTWSKITNNPSQRVFCVQPGDHTAKGPLTIGFSGSSSSYKVLRYHRANDTDDDPWKQSAANQAKVNRVKFIGARYWIVHRLVFDPNYASGSFAVHLADGTTRSERIVVNRVLAQHGAKQVHVEGANNTVIQNSVLRESIRAKGVDSDGVALSYQPQNTWIVNNEIYRIHSHGAYTSANSNSPGTVIENNDIYVDSSQWTNCSGAYTPSNPNSPCSDAEAAISIKSGGTKANPIRIVHNRMWGYRWTDTNVCCIAGSEAPVISLSQEANTAAYWVAAVNNIMTDSQHGFVSAREGSHNNSIIGNLLYRIKNYRNSGTSRSSAFDSLGHWDNNEVYLNTVIDSHSWALIGSGNGNLDIKCNAIVASGASAGANPDAGTDIEYNAFIGTTRFTTSNLNTDVTKSILQRANSTSYSLGSIVQFAPITACTSGKESACFLYMAANPGTSGPSAPQACTVLGCEFPDGGVTWQAVRGPYFYKRKLRTVPGGETAFVPYARVHASAPERFACDTQVGTRIGIGIDDLPLL